MIEDALSLARDWPGKSKPREHPAIWHMLDVAACAERLIENHRAFSGFSSSQRRGLVVLVALHDVGKISQTFRAMLRDQGPSIYRHWTLSDLLLTTVLDPIIGRALGGDAYSRSELYAAVSGHHGGPPDRSFNRRENKRRGNSIGYRATRAASAWTSILLKILPSGSLAGINQRAARRLSWALSGLTVASDWVGSNTDWFPPASPDIAPADYLKCARAQAQKAVLEAGLNTVPVSLGVDAQTLTQFQHLRPMQSATEKVVLPSGPVLALIEDATGAGKTEAAMILAHRMITLGRASGLFFALPTMATANAMFERMTKAAARLFESPPSLTLAHGRAALHEGFRSLIGARDDTTPEAGCTRWLADDRRRSLLAEIGVGTIDQALMGILPTRFATLRLFGLVDRVLVVDEAHNYDPYMQRQLEVLLKMQAMGGGSAIVMTATLPMGMRQAYADAFRSGLGRSAVQLSHRDYPAFALVGSEVQSRSVKPVPTTCRSVRVKRIESEEIAIEMLVKGAQAGAACLWVRNAVDDAIGAVKWLHDQGCAASLLHARFAIGDRLRHEAMALARFGRDGIGRAGRVLVATQVVETSLDLDFDLMVSDLAPIGALIQRAGRLWRHMDRRPVKARPAPGPELVILSPDPERVTDARWLNRVLGRGAYVYRHDHQWRTAQSVFDAGSIISPDTLRTLIESVHGSNPLEVPEPLTDALFDAEGMALAESAIAQQNVITPEDGYLKGTKGGVWSEEKFPTRLGEEDMTLVLARRNGHRLSPWCDAETSMNSWALSEVRCAARRIRPVELPDQSDPEIAQVKAVWSRGKRDHLVLCPVGEDGLVSNGLRYDPEWGLMFSP